MSLDDAGPARVLFRTRSISRWVCASAPAIGVLSSWALLAAKSRSASKAARSRSIKRVKARAIGRARAAGRRLPQATGWRYRGPRSRPAAAERAHPDANGQPDRQRAERNKQQQRQEQRESAAEQRLAAGQWSARPPYGEPGFRIGQREDAIVAAVLKPGGAAASKGSRARRAVFSSDPPGASPQLVAQPVGRGLPRSGASRGHLGPAREPAVGCKRQEPPCRLHQGVVEALVEFVPEDAGGDGGRASQSSVVPIVRTRMSRAVIGGRGPMAHGHARTCSRGRAPSRSPRGRASAAAG